MSGATENAATGERKRWKHGKTIRDGELRLTSVSALEGADMNSASGCLRKWFYRYALGIKEDEEDSESLKRGNENHAAVAKYLLTGINELPTIVLRGKHMLPPPGPDLGVELDIVPDLPDGRSGLALARLRVAGVPVTGAIDLVHPRRENYGTDNPEEQLDPPGILKLVDHKFPYGMERAKTPRELIEAFQMAGYGIWAFETFPGLRQVRLSHNYFPVKGQPRVSTVLACREQLEETWKRATVVAGSMRDAARETNPDNVPANGEACRAYGRLCPAAGVCSEFKRAEQDEYGLSDVMGRTAADRFFLPVLNGVQADICNPVIGDTRMSNQQFAPVQPNSVLAFVQGAAAPPPAAPQSQAVLPQFVQPMPAPMPMQAAPQSGPSQAEIAAEMARLAAIEQASTTPPAIAAPLFAPPPAPAPPPPQLPSNWLDRCSVMGQQSGAHPALAMIAQTRGFGLGFPTLSGFAAGTIGNLIGILPTPRGVDHFLDGEGEYGQHTLADPNLLPRLLEEARGAAARRAAQAQATPVIPQPAPAPAPTSAPTSAPEPAPQPPAPQVVQTIVGPAVVTPMPAPMPAMGALPPDAPPSNPMIASKPPEAAPTAPAEKPKKSKKAKDAPAEATTVTNVVNVTGAPVSDAVISDAAQPAGAINFYVDVVADGLALQPFWPVLDFITDQMSKDSGCADFRMQEQGKYSHGNWKGHIRAAMRELVTRGLLKPGNYGLNGTMGEIAIVAIEGMQEIARKTGGIYVRGAR